MTQAHALPFSASLDEGLSGATRVYFIVGDPIAQVRSPSGVTAALRAAGRDALVVPAHVASADLPAFFAGVTPMRNVDGVIITVPHKFSAAEYCSTLSKEAGFLGAVNTLRRTADGLWHGGMFDGTGFVAALVDAGCELRGKRALLIGAGGAGSAIGHTDAKRRRLARRARQRCGTHGFAGRAIECARAWRSTQRRRRGGSSCIRRGRECVAARHARGRSVADRLIALACHDVRRRCRD
jgi:hypothetical protein